MAGASNYYRWSLDRISEHLGDFILDIGGGYGGHLEPILESGRRVVSLDLSPEAVEEVQRRCGHRPGFDALCADFLEAETCLDLAGRGFDTILCLNVLEHIEDDLWALESMREILEGSEGTVILQVPAHTWLYGRLDTLAGHYRRYSAADLARRMVRSGFRAVRVSHFNRFGVLPWFVNGRIMKPAAIDNESIGVQVRVFDRYLVPLARMVEKVLPLPVGQSLVAVGRAGSEPKPC
jgi:SAM-dependent methyltransferase